MKGEWCYFKQRWNPDLCQDVLRRARSMPSQDAVIGNTVGSMGVNLDYRRSRVTFVNADDFQFQDVFEDLWKMAIAANRDFFNVHITKLDFIQIAEYNADNQGEYKQHHDVFWINNSEWHRKISCVIQLTDPDEYEGGDLQLLDVSQTPLASDIRMQGSALFFPSFMMHRANPVTRGVRYSIAAWFEGPKWR